MTGNKKPAATHSVRHRRFPGIGAAIAESLARNGFDVAVSEHTDGGLTDTIARIESAGARAVPVVLDLHAHSHIEQAMAKVLGAFGNLDLLVNNAGIPLLKPVVEVTREDWNAVIDVNLAGTFFMSQQMGRHLIGTGRKGSIINIASTHGLVGIQNVSVYGITKAGVMHMTRMLAIEWASRGIRVNAIAPGTTETAARAKTYRADPARRQVLIERIPFGRFCTEDDIAACASYLASPQADYITGQTLVLDGGLTSY